MGRAVALLLPFAVLSYALVVLWSRKGLRTYLIASPFWPPPNER